MLKDLIEARGKSDVLGGSEAGDAGRGVVDFVTGGANTEAAAEEAAALAEAVAAETTYESGEGNAMIIPVPIQQTKTVSTGGGGRRGEGGSCGSVGRAGGNGGAEGNGGDGEGGGGGCNGLPESST